MSQHTPVKTETCLDCKVLPPFSIVLCPMHAAARRMLELLGKFSHKVEYALRTGDDFVGPWKRHLLDEARALLKEIEG